MRVYVIVNKNTEVQLQKLLFIAKDPGAANVTLPVASCFRSSQLFAVVEGNAKEQYEGSGIPFKFLVGQPEDVLQTIQPDAVICGLSYPINLEEAYGCAANQLGIPLVEIEDFWGAHVRSSAIPNVIGVIDSYAGEIAQRRHVSANIICSGSPGVFAKRIIPEAATYEYVHGLADGAMTVVVPLSIDYDVADLLVECLRITGRRIVLLPRLHPKCEGVRIPGLGVTYDEYYRDTLSRHNNSVHWTMHKLEDVIVSSDALIMGYSTTMFTALQHERMVASLWTPQTRRMVQATGGIDNLPWFQKGLPVTEHPQDLNDLLKPTPQIFSSLVPFDPARIAVVIEAL